MNEELEQQTDYRGYKEINEAIDNMNIKVLELESKIDTVAVFYYTIMAYFSGKLTKEEVKNIKNRFDKASADEISKFTKAFELMQDKNEEVSSIVDMLDALEEDRWNND